MWQDDVRQFMIEVKELELPRQPTPTKANVRNLCYELIKEEFDELTEHMMHETPYQSLVSIADDLADLVYVVLYTANAYGIHLDPIFKEVHRSNMTKKGGLKREDGKQLKPETYESPNLGPLIEAQIYTEISYIDGKPTGWLNKETKHIVNDL